MLVQPSLAQENDGTSNLQVVPGTWYKLTSDNVTVLFPSGGRKPMFIWWYNNEPNRIYVVKYQGLMEYFAFDNSLLGTGNPMYYTRMREAWSYRFGEMLENRWMGMGMQHVDRPRQLWTQTATLWHNAFLPFDAARWNLTDIKNITDTTGKAVRCFICLQACVHTAERLQICREQHNDPSALLQPKRHRNRSRNIRHYIV